MSEHPFTRSEWLCFVDACVLGAQHFAPALGRFSASAREPFRRSTAGMRAKRCGT